MLSYRIRLDAQSNYTQPIAAVSLNNMLRRTRRAGHLALPARHLPVTSHHPCGCGRAAADMHTLVYLCDTGIAYVEPCVQKLRSSSLKDAQFADSRAVWLYSHNESLLFHATLVSMSFNNVINYRLMNITTPLQVQDLRTLLVPHYTPTLPKILYRISVESCRNLLTSYRTYFFL